MVTTFTARLLASIDRSAVNAVCSPLSAQVALTMAGLGARGTTRAQMEQVLGADMEQRARTAQQLREVLAAVGEAERSHSRAGRPEPARASLVGRAWAQQGTAVRPQYREQLATGFGAELGEIDVRDESSREAARREINQWVEDQTNQLIEDLIPPGALTSRERLVLVSALHVKAAWPVPLTAAQGTFTTAAGAARNVQMLSGAAGGWYGDEHCRATALPTAGGEISLALIQPTAGIDEVLEAWAHGAEHSGTGLDALLEGLGASQDRVGLTVPSLDISWDAELSGTLQQLGMTEAFGPGADFTGIAEGADWFLSLVLQKAVLTVDQHGMEAAAATVLMTRRSAAAPPQRRLVLDSPFLFLAYERSTLAPLVIGWIGDPTEAR